MATRPSRSTKRLSSVSITTDDGSGFTTIEVEAPDGTITYNGGADGKPTSVIKLKKAKPGTYLVRTMTNNPPTQGDAYSGVARAELGAYPNLTGRAVAFAA